MIPSRLFVFKNTKISFLMETAFLKHAKPNPDSHSTIRVRIRLCMPVQHFLIEYIITDSPHYLLNGEPHFSGIERSTLLWDKLRGVEQKNKAGIDIPADFLGRFVPLLLVFCHIFYRIFAVGCVLIYVF